MKILKYISLLLLLAFVASVVFFATLDRTYDVLRTKTINAPKTQVFNYVNDLKNWENFGSWKQDDPKMKSIFSKKTIGKGSYYSWKGQDGEGKMTTVFVKSNDSIHQKMSFNDAESNVYWSFNETNGKTKVTWRNIGKMDFTTIIFTTLFGGMDQIIGNMYEKSLTNIENNLKNKVTTHSVIADGFIETTMGMYLQKTINSSNENLDNNIQIMIPNLMRFTQKNKISISGKPFVKYNSSNDLKGTTNFSVCISIKDSIITSKSSEYTFDKMLPFQAMKATLIGDLSFKNEAKIKALELITENNLMQKSEIPIIEVYKINLLDTKDANKWITEIYVPVKKKDYIKKYVKPLIKNKISTKITPTETPNPVSNTPIPEKIIIRKDFPQ
jgi:predicted transcriptional regulator YdeE